MLSSTEAAERKTAALVCGRERLTTAIPKLKDLLSDQEYFTTNHPKSWTRVYYVRQAAKDALEKLGEDVGHVAVTAPD